MFTRLISRVRRLFLKKKKGEKKKDSSIYPMF